MDLGWLSWYTLLLGSAVIIVLVFDVWSRKRYFRLPPGPAGWPIMGNLLQVGNKPHESFFKLATKYGPLMTISLGMKMTVVVSSSAMAKEVLKTHDQTFSGRIVPEAAKAYSHYKNSIVYGQYGSHWRMLRRISNTELFSVKRLEALQHFRRDQVNRMIHQIFEDAVKGKCVDIGHTAFQSAFNLLGKMVFGKDVFDPQFARASQELKDALSQVLVLLATPNLADFFPCLQFLDPQSVYRNTETYFKKLYDVMDKFIEDRLGTALGEGRERSYSEKNLLEVLLEMRSDEFTLAHIRGYLVDIFGAGSDTTATTIEWAMTELIRNPEKMKRVQAELEEVIGRERMVEESDAEHLPYLCAVVKEVFRLHPAVPFLIPHRADNRCEIAGFVIPKHTQIIVNVWAIGRDPSIWKEPLKFIPERFIEKETSSTVDYRGQHFELLPFGAGRRMCVGLPLATRMVHLLLASLVQSFEWALPQGMTANQVDMNDRFGLTLVKAVPLEAIPKPRLPSKMYCF